MQRAHHRHERALPRFVTVILALGLAAGACTGDGGEAATPEEPPLPEFQFEISQVRTVPMDAKPGKAEVNEAAADVEALLDELYTLGFIDPARWENGRFSGLTTLFSGPAARQARRDREDLTLGTAAQQIERVEPSAGTLELSLLMDPKARPVAAIAETRFEAVGRTMQGQDLTILHEGRFILRPVEGAWLIVGYEVTGNLETEGAEVGP